MYFHNPFMGYCWYIVSLISLGVFMWFCWCIIGLKWPIHAWKWFPRLFSAFVGSFEFQPDLGLEILQLALCVSESLGLYGSAPLVFFTSWFPHLLAPHNNRLMLQHSESQRWIGTRFQQVVFGHESKLLWSIAGNSIVI